MIPHEELVAALKQWRHDQGLPSRAVLSETHTPFNGQPEESEFLDAIAADVDMEVSEAYENTSQNSWDNQTDHDSESEEEGPVDLEAQSEDASVNEQSEIDAPIEDAVVNDDSVYNAYEPEGATKAHDPNEENPEYFDENNNSYYDDIEAEKVEQEAVSASEDEQDSEPSEESEEPAHPFEDNGDDDDFDDSVGEKTTIGELDDEDYN